VHLLKFRTCNFYVPGWWNFLNRFVGKPATNCLLKFVHAAIIKYSLLIRRLFRNSFILRLHIIVNTRITTFECIFCSYRACSIRLMRVPPICISDIQTLFWRIFGRLLVFSAHINPGSRIHYNTAGVHMRYVIRLGYNCLLMLVWCTCSERSRYSETSLATERFFLVVTPYSRMNHAIRTRNT